MYEKKEKKKKIVLRCLTAKNLDLKQGELESSGWRLISSIGLTKEEKKKKI